jgi:hypothetical protein
MLSVMAPGKSMRRTFSSQCAWSVLGRSRTKYTATQARMEMGNWPIKAQRQPIESAVSPPRGAPLAMPAANTMLMYPCHTPRSRRETRSVIRMDTTAFIPPPPMPATAREMQSERISCDRPQPRQPMPKTVYANRRHSLRPKISLNLPYSGWKVVSVKKYLLLPSRRQIRSATRSGKSSEKGLSIFHPYDVAIQLVLFRAFRSDPILPYVATTSVWSMATRNTYMHTFSSAFRIFPSKAERLLGLALFWDDVTYTDGEGR